MARQLLQTINAGEWDSQTPAPGSGTKRVRFLQDVSDLVDRPLNNRLTVSAPNTAIACSGKTQSSSIGVGPMQPKRYAEFTVKARVTFNASSAGPVFIYVYRTLKAIPANGAPPNAGDIVVSGDAFTGGPTSPGVNQSASFSFLDTGLDVNTRYSYYFAVSGPQGTALNVINQSQLLVMERS